MATKKKKAKKKELTPIKNQARLMAQSPEEMEGMWDEETQEAWNNLSPKHQSFFLAYLQNNYNAAGAYKETYNKDADNLVAASSGRRMLINVNIQTLCGKLNESKKSDLTAIRKAYNDALEAKETIQTNGVLKESDVADHKVRLKAAEGIAKLNGELTEKADNNVVINKTLTINHQVVGDMNDYLAKLGHAPLVPTKAVTEVTNPIKKKPDEPTIDFEAFGEGDIELIE